MDLLITVAVAQITFLTLKEKIILFKNIDSLDNLALMSIQDISLMVGRPVKTADWNGKTAAEMARKSVSIMKNLQIGVVRYDQEEYPALLREIFDPPFAVFYRGNLAVLAKECVSVVGTRRVTREGASAAFSFAKEAALNGLTVVSGLAYGTDTYAHKGAVSAFDEAELSGTTAAVLPCGIDIVTPSPNKRLAENILRTKGCILSEYIPGTPAEPWRFVQRNRIIAALAPAVVVIEAPPGSGALITADFAMEYNRDLLLHSSCFSGKAKEIADDVEKKLLSSAKSGTKTKLNRNTAHYLDEGAPVIDNYADYVRVRKDPPGTYGCKKQLQQGLLFS